MGTIITNGLRGCWDAGTSLSYPGSGTTWNDLVGSANATFDGATYSAFNGGSVLFDSDKVTVADTTTIDGQYGFSFEIWVYFLGPGDGSSTYNFFSVYNGDGTYEYTKYPSDTLLSGSMAMEVDWNLVFISETILPFRLADVALAGRTQGGLR